MKNKFNDSIPYNVLTSNFVFMFFRVSVQFDFTIVECKLSVELPKFNLRFSVPKFIEFLITVFSSPLRPHSSKISVLRFS